MKIKPINYAIDARDGYSPVFNGKIGQVLQNEKGKEYFRRSPGVRAIIPTETGLIFQKEKREYLDQPWDYRLTGGKVADTLCEYLDFLEKDGSDNSGNEYLLREAIVREAKEEIGIIIEKLKPFYVSPSSATVEHDLHYYLVEEFQKDKARPEDDERIEIVEMTYKEVFKLLLERQFSEDRTRAVLFEYLLNEKKHLIF